MKLTHDEAIAAIREAQLIAHAHPNGADWLECPFCNKTQPVQGYAGNETWYPGHSFEHYPGCVMLRAWEGDTEKKEDVAEGAVYESVHPNSDKIYTGSRWDDHCPECGEGVRSTCKCHIGDRICQNGHKWYRNEYCEAVRGSGHNGN